MGWNYLSFPNFNGCTVEVWEWISYFIPTLHWACDYLCVMKLKSIHISKRASGRFYPHPSGLFNKHWGNHTIAPVSAKQLWSMWVNVHESARNSQNNQNKTKHKKIVYIMGYIFVVHSAYYFVLLNHPIGPIWLPGPIWWHIKYREE